MRTREIFFWELLIKKIKNKPNKTIRVYVKETLSPLDAASRGYRSPLGPRDVVRHTIRHESLLGID